MATTNKKQTKKTNLTSTSDRTTNMPVQIYKTLLNFDTNIRNNF